MSWDEAEARYGGQAEAVLEAVGHPATAANRAAIVSQVAVLFDEVNASLGIRNNASNTITTAKLWDRWCDYFSDKRTNGTFKRYKTSVMSFVDHVGHKDIRSITGDDVYDWAKNRNQKDGVSASGINRVDLAAVRSVFGWALQRQGGRLISHNPADGVRLDEPRTTRTRERTFRRDEINAILHASYHVERPGKNPSDERARRWAPWIAAYSGARISEITGLTREHFRLEDGIWVIDFLFTKKNVPRTIPVHGHLIDQGLIDEVHALPSGPIFYDEVRHSSATKTPPNEIRSSKLSRWIRQTVDLTEGVDPNHGWRHTWKTIALEHGIEARIRDAITGHAQTSVGRRYEAPTIQMMTTALKMFPRYQVQPRNT